MALATTIISIILILMSFLLVVAPGAYLAKTGLFTLLHCGSDVGAHNGSVNDILDLDHLLGELPHAAAPEGFADLSSGSSSVRGVCVGDSRPEDCHECLDDASWSLMHGCDPPARRARAWSNGCYVAYNYSGATNTSPDDSSDSREVFCHGDFTGSYVDGAESSFHYHMFWEQTLAALASDLAKSAASGDPAPRLAAGQASYNTYGYDGTVHALAQCARGRAAADCFRCLQASATQATLSCGGYRFGWVQGGHVLSNGCYLRFTVTSGCDSAPASGSAVLRWLVSALVTAAALLHGC